MSRFTIALSGTAMLAITGCASIPSGPGVMVLPGSGMSFERFSNDNVVCQQFASYQVGGTTPNQAGMSSGVTSAIVGTVVGAAAGAALGVAGGPNGAATGAAVGAGAGLLGGSMIGVGKASNSMYEAQQRYDAAYVQCMYAKGHQVPVSGQFAGALPQQSVAPPPPPPPPSGATPPRNRPMSPSGPSSSEDIPPPPSGSPPAPPPQ